MLKHVSWAGYDMRAWEISRAGAYESKNIGGQKCVCGVSGVAVK